MRYNTTIDFVEQTQTSDGMGGSITEDVVIYSAQAHVQPLNYYDSQKLGLKKAYRVVLKNAMDFEGTTNIKIGPTSFSLLGAPISKSKTTFVMSEV